MKLVQRIERKTYPDEAANPIAAICPRTRFHTAHSSSGAAIAMMLRWNRVACVFVVVILAIFLHETTCQGKTTQLDLKSDDATTQALDKLSDESAKLLHWDLRQYNRFVVNSTRQFGIAVLITATAESYRCEMCGQLETDFAAVAQHYAKHRSDRQNPLPLYFAVFDADRIREFFLKHKISHVPLVGYFHPKTTASHADSSSSFHLSAGDALLGAPSILDYCNKMHSTDIPKMVSFRRTFTISSVIALLFAATAHYAHLHFDTLLTLLTSRWLWFTLSMAVYAFSISGLLHNITQPSLLQPWPPSSSSRMAHATTSSLLHPAPDHQHAVEGLAAAMMGVLAGAIIILLGLRTTPPLSIAHSPLRMFHQSAQNAIYLALLLCLLYTLLTWIEFKRPWYSLYAALPRSVQAALAQLYLSKTTRWFVDAIDILWWWVAAPDVF
ncbi:Aste57867_24187 [Aphanomyces stellatus]|uniref:Aste57867_24187 protein n=1 Tax=Aphanomyces stellatus TaxID=120398 RepID=A0A485LU38_9STRA|nr:hypothetical protein As57867_024113 [Aphanomyces stellatus]VFU00829.1 Aste57867_24187 [Aphanomyces stellatus]